MKNLISLLFSLILSAYCADAVIFSSGFEDGLAQWQVPETPAKIKITDQAYEGNHALSINFDPGSSPQARHAGVLFSKPIPLKQGVYRLTGKIMFPEGYGTTIGIDFYNSAGKRVADKGIHFGSAPASKSAWNDITVTASSYDEDTASARLKLFIPFRVKQQILLDDIKLETIPAATISTPWVPQYKRHPGDTMTAADIPGPDGIVYPDFSMAGIRDAVYFRTDATKISLADLGVKSGDDILPMLQQALSQLPANGGIIEIPAGHFRMSGFLTITGNHVIIKGAGREKTRINFDYDPGDGMVDLYGLKENDRLAPRQHIHLYSRPKNLKSLHLSADGKEFAKFAVSLHSGNQSYLTAALPSSLTPGKHLIKGTAKYSDGKVFQIEKTIDVSPGTASTLPAFAPGGIFHFRGKGFAFKDYRLAADGKRGDTSVILRNADHPFKPGDAVLLRAQETPRRRAETGNACTWGTHRNTMFFVEKVEGARITFNQPMRIDFPEIDESFLRKLELIKGGGIESMTLETTKDFWVNSVYFQFASDCRAYDLKVLKAGRNPVYANNAKFCSVINCEFADAWFKGGGGTAYVGWDTSHDCLIDNVESRRMRHAPVVQWGASGNVIRNSRFYDCDAHWHAGWAHENLFENCVIISDSTAHGGYGNALWASAPEDGAHGPIGPRNVVYNCDTFSLGDAVKLGGMNENWIFAYNRFKVKKGTVFYLNAASFDHIIKNNHAIIEDGNSPFILLTSPDCLGIEITGNTIATNNKILSKGIIAPAVDKDNKFVFAGTELPRPQPQIPSIYEWQLKQKRNAK